METGSSSKHAKKHPEMEREKVRDGGSAPAKIERFVPRMDHNPWELRSWAKRTGFVSNFSGESNVSGTVAADSVAGGTRFGGEEGKGNSGSLVRQGNDGKVVVGGRVSLGSEIRPDGDNGGEVKMRTGVGEEGGLRGEAQDEGRKNSDSKAGANVNGTERPNTKDTGNHTSNGRGHQMIAPVVESEGQEEKDREDLEINVYPVDGEEQEIGWWSKPPGVRLGLSDKPGIGPTIYYGLQHFLSLAGSLIFIPIIMVPTMGGSDRDTATVISTMLFVSGITTIIASFFGTRLPLVQGSSFVFLAPALVIINSRDYRNLTEHKFRHIMRELQGAIIVSSIFQSILGFSGLMSLLVRFLNPIVVAPTVASVGLAFFSFGFPQAGSCVEISVPLIALALLFSLHLRGISIFGHRLFQIYAVPFSVMGIWAYTFFLTAGGAYNYKGCNPDVPSSNILIDSCRKHSYTMKHCRTDASNAWETASWIGVPYPFQWGVPIFSSRTCIIMVIASLVASVDSVGTYHATSLLAASKPPTRGIVSRGIALEGFCSLLAGIWGTGTGSTTLTENVYTISSTKVANRRVVQVGAVFLIFFSFIGKVGGILASIPQALAASVLCFEWAVVVALGLWNLQHIRMSSFRNMIIIGVSLFLGFSIPAYFQQYQPTTSLMVPSYLVPFSGASDGPFGSGSQVDFAMNALLSLNMVVTFFVAVVLDNTVPGNWEQRGVYNWSSRADISTDPSLLADYSLPRKIFGNICPTKGTLPFRLLAAEYGADITYGEEIIDHKLIKCERRINERLGSVDIVENGTEIVVFRTCKQERDHVVFQIGTSDAVRALRAAELVCQDVAAVDVNMGCPKSFSLSGGMGAALLSKPDLIYDILTTLKRNLDIPVTCKIRLLQSSHDTVQLARIIEKTGVSALAVHGRRVADRPRDPAKWTEIIDIVNALSIPVIANGDVFEYEDFERIKAATGASSVMVARGAMWNASIFSPKGKLPWEDVKREYIRKCILWDNDVKNSKYTLKEMLNHNSSINSSEGKAISKSESLADLAQLYGEEDYYQTVIRCRHEKL